MPQPTHLAFQPDLFGAGEITFDARFERLQRIALDDTAWIEYAPGWLTGADRLFEEILSHRKWAQRTRQMYEKRVREPRLTAPWNMASGVSLEPRVLEDVRVCLSSRYGVVFDSVGFNLYRDGQDSVAWHGDHIAREIEEPIVALLSVGEPRKFLLRPKGGGAAHQFQLGRGDLLMTCGRTQRTWEHSVPKVRHAGPRISLAFRYGMNAHAYGVTR